MIYYIANPALGKPGDRLGKPYTDSPPWIDKALRKGHITKSASGVAGRAKTKTKKPTKAARK